MDTLITDSDASQVWKGAFERLSPRILEVPKEGLPPINIDVSAAVTTALGAVKRMRGMTLPAWFAPPGFDAAHFDEFVELAHALGWAQYLLRATEPPVRPIEQQAQALAVVRDQLFADATALAKRGVIGGRRLDEIKHGNGYQTIIDDTMVLVTMLSAHEADVIANSGIAEGELARIAASADELTSLLGARSEQSAEVSERTDMRQRAFALFVRAYDQLRRHVVFLRWDEGDADVIAPSVYSGKRRKSDSGSDTGSELPASAEPASAEPPASAGAAAPEGGDAKPAAAMRGGSPFVGG